MYGRGVLRLITGRLELKPLSSQAAAALSENQEEASRILGATFPPEWPQPDLLGILALRPPSSPEAERFGVWVMIERDSGSVVGDIGFKGPPDDAGRIEMGYSVIQTVAVAVTQRRRRGRSSTGHFRSRRSGSWWPAASLTMCPPFGRSNGSVSIGVVKRMARSDGATEATLARFDRGDDLQTGRTASERSDRTPQRG